MSESRPRSAAELNEQIRALMVCSGGRLTGPQRAEYQSLLEQWAAAVRRSAVRPEPPRVPGPRRGVADRTAVG
ncbi:hypothetical protein GCM10018793_20550 [Streptomyces sulfonofaciens]|uniref:Uncharacterized protein n=2 Tax=Streptomyces sulfonofaciens TaxID=68272 RepID=A0A919KX17_9ACTN|nr:hypothetical protein GCM10018793_20550 [Streptomyces sulfonofaciens]